MINPFLLTEDSKVLVSGDTLPHRSRFRALGGAWNSQRKGWEFKNLTLARRTALVELSRNLSHLDITWEIYNDV